MTPCVKNKQKVSKLKMHAIYKIFLSMLLYKLDGYLFTFEMSQFS